MKTKVICITPDGRRKTIKGEVVIDNNDPNKASLPDGRQLTKINNNWVCVIK